jgi:hypothetical protein
MISASRPGMARQAAAPSAIATITIEGASANDIRGHGAAQREPDDSRHDQEAVPHGDEGRHASR